jgi:hypothetical protein
MQIKPSLPFVPVVGLGQLRKLYPYNKKSIIYDVSWEGIFFIVIGGLLSLEIFKLSQLNTEYFIFIFFALGETFIILYDRRNWPLAAALYEDGFAYYDRISLLQVRWEQIKKLEDKIGERQIIKGLMSYEGTSVHYYTIFTEGGGKIALNEKLCDIEDLWLSIESGAAKV